MRRTGLLRTSAALWLLAAAALCNSMIAINTAAAGGSFIETAARLANAMTANGVSLAPLAECN